MARKFTYNGMELPDPSPELSAQQVRDIYSATYPDLATASITGPEKVGDDQVFKFSRAVGTKG